MSAVGRRIAAPLAVAIFGIGLGATFAYAAPASPHLPASPGKPVAPIAIGYEFATQPALGVPFEVRISAQGGAGIADLTLTVQPGLGVQAGTPQLTTSSADGGARTWNVAATAFNEGTLYLSVLVQGTAGDQHPARNLVMPIRIGTESPTTPAVSVQSADFSGKPVIVLPAERAR
jgi:hypothetical protein